MILERILYLSSKEEEFSLPLGTQPLSLLQNLFIKQCGLFSESLFYPLCLRILFFHLLKNLLLSTLYRPNYFPTICIEGAI